MPFQDIHNRVDAKLHPELARDVDRASQALSEILGSAAESIQVDWSLAELRAESAVEPRPDVRLEMRSPLFGAFETTVSSRDFQDPERLWWRLNDAWGEALRKGTKESLKRLD